MNKFWKVYWVLALVVAATNTVVYYTDQTYRHSVTMALSILYMGMGMLFDKATAAD
jgi:hypothetical protein